MLSVEIKFNGKVIYRLGIVQDGVVSDRFVGLEPVSQVRNYRITMYRLVHDRCDGFLVLVLLALKEEIRRERGG